MLFKSHSFHIPVMGIGYTIDTPIKVSHLGIDSVISLVDDGLIEKMRYHHSIKSGKEFVPVSVKTLDYRAERIRLYLNLISEIVEEKFRKLQDDFLKEGSDLFTYLKLLPDYSAVKKAIKKAGMNTLTADFKLTESIKNLLQKGSIDVNIMSKGDTVRYKNSKEKLPSEFNDAHAAVRGFMKSELKNSSLIISAGLNPKLYTYISTFKEVLPNNQGEFEKKIVIKVSDYRSALVQGKFLAQKGVFVSEFRIESGLNCGGHAFATKGNLIGPILQEFKDKRKELISEITSLYNNYLLSKEIILEKDLPEIRFTAQGGVGSSEEHEFLLKKYDLHSIGWGSLFLLANDVVNIDADTLDLVANADESSIYLSDTSPFGIPFYSVKGNSKDEEKEKRIQSKKPGSICPKRFVALNNEFGDKALCTASKEYQTLKIKEIEKSNLIEEAKEKEIRKVLNRTCICIGLGTSALIVNNLERRLEGNTTSICPGPNLAYFSKKSNLIETVDHIYGRSNLLTNANRPNLFIKELLLYIDYFKEFYLEKTQDEKQITYNSEFINNLLEGIKYYNELFIQDDSFTINQKSHMNKNLTSIEIELRKLQLTKTAV